MSSQIQNYRLVTLNVNTTTDTQEVIRIFENASTGAQRVPIILLAVVIAPIAEEVVFRGHLYGVFRVSPGNGIYVR